MSCKSSENRSPDRSCLPIWKKAAFAFVTTIAFFSLLEVLLAAIGIRPFVDTHDPFVGFASNLPLFVEAEANDGRAVMTTAPNKLAYFNKQSFPLRKANDTCRIFCLGGSTTYGRPYTDNTSFPGWLRELLPVADASKDWEVINAGGISYASYRVATLMEELSDYEPDLFIVYTGHNEFLEERTYENLRHAFPRQIQLASTVAKTRLYGVMRELLAPPSTTSHYELPGEVDAILDHTVGPSSYHRDDELKQQVVAHFIFNMQRMLKIAESCGAEIIFITPVCNLKDFSPFKSENVFADDSLQAVEWSKFFEQARDLEQAENFADAIEAYQQAEKIDDRFADLQFKKGRCQLAVGRLAEADRALRRAVDEDVCSLRAIKEILDAIREVSHELQIPLVDFEARLKNECLKADGHNIPGREYFLDHVHPNIETNRTIALSIIGRMIELTLVKPAESWNYHAIAAVSELVESNIDDAAHAVALRNLAKVLNWSGKHYEAGPLALQAAKTLPDDPEALFLSAAYLKMTGDAAQAVEHYRRVLAIKPDYSEAHQRLGAALVEEKQYEEALKHFKTVAGLKPDDAQAHQMVGAILAEVGRFDQAITEYNRALQLDGNDANVHYNLGLAFERLGQADEARAHYRRAIRLDPDDTVAREKLFAILKNVDFATPNQNID